MPNHQLAEVLLRMVAPADRAAATVGDLLEEVPRRGTTWFWLGIVRTIVAIVWHDMMSTPFSTAAAALVGWLGFMLLALFLDAAGQIAARVVWAIGYVLAHHTGAELIVDALRVRFDWAPPPPAVTHTVQWIAILVLAPMQTGRIIAQYWQRRALAYTAMQAIVWSLLVGLVPFVAFFGSRVTLDILPVLQTFIFVGMLRERWSQVLLTTRLQRVEGGAFEPPAGR